PSYVRAGLDRSAGQTVSENRVAVVDQFERVVDQTSIFGNGGPVDCFGRLHSCAFENGPAVSPPGVRDNDALPSTYEPAQIRIVGPPNVFTHLGVDDQIPLVGCQGLGELRIENNGRHSSDQACLFFKLQRVSVGGLRRQPSALVVKNALAALRAKAMDLPPDQSRAFLGVGEGV